MSRTRAQQHGALQRKLNPIERHEGARRPSPCSTHPVVHLAGGWLPSDGCIGSAAQAGGATRQLFEVATWMADRHNLSVGSRPVASIPAQRAGTILCAGLQGQQAESQSPAACTVSTTPTS